MYTAEMLDEDSRPVLSRAMSQRNRRPNVGTAVGQEVWRSNRGKSVKKSKPAMFGQNETCQLDYSLSSTTDRPSQSGPAPYRASAWCMGQPGTP
jgi:hypothetical protein